MRNSYHVYKLYLALKFQEKFGIKTRKKAKCSKKTNWVQKIKVPHCLVDLKISLVSALT